MNLAPYTTSKGAEPIRLLTLDPGHFHAALVQKFMYPQVNPVVRVYAPEGPDLESHLKMVGSFNTRAENPTRWEEKVYTGPDFLGRMLREKAGNVVVLAGNNTRKTEYIHACIKAGFDVLADKPMAITPAQFGLLRKAFAAAAKKKLVLYDIMTERYEITAILQKELAASPEVFGALEKGTPDQPAVEMESVHHFFKEVAGKPLIRPAWFFDVRQEGEAIPDVGTHLIDLVQWECFPDRALDWKKDVKVAKARRWATKLTAAEFQHATGVARYPDFLKKDVTPDGCLQVFGNGEVSYALCGTQVRVRTLWNYEAPAGAGDTFFSVMRGTRATLSIKQGKEQQYRPKLYVESKAGSSAPEFERVLRQAIERSSAKWPGITLQASGNLWEVVVPEKYQVGHEAHFAQVTERYLQYVAERKMPAWEVPNMLAKYYTTTEAYRLSHKTP
ncbi:MAG TPA: putative oxidoreductase C-terminal domain-containing protein [Verrucomicrobiae bacterium]